MQHACPKPGACQGSARSTHKTSTGWHEDSNTTRLLMVVHSTTSTSCTYPWTDHNQPLSLSLRHIPAHAPNSLLLAPRTPLDHSCSDTCLSCPKLNSASSAVVTPFKLFSKGSNTPPGDPLLEPNRDTPSWVDDTALEDARERTMAVNPARRSNRAAAAPSV